jgi:hypothetical protein
MQIQTLGKLTTEETMKLIEDRGFAERLFKLCYTAPRDFAENDLTVPNSKRSS